MKCVICGKELSRYNPNDRCWSHFVEDDYDLKGESIKQMYICTTSGVDLPFRKTEAQYQGRYYR